MPSGPQEPQLPALAARDEVVLPREALVWDPAQGGHVRPGCVQEQEGPGRHRRLHQERHEGYLKADLKDARRSI